MSWAREVFVDTSILYALVDKRDAIHTPARDTVRGLLHSRYRLVTTDYIVAETVNLANARGGTHVGVRVLDLFERSEGIRIEWIGSLRFELTRTFFRRHADHRYSFTDCSSFVVMHELRLRQALTTDKRFREAGFEAPLTAA